MTAKVALFTALKNDLYLSELAKSTWLVRPVIYEVLALLYHAFKARRVHGAFIFSNNGSQELVDFVAFYCNAYMRRKFQDFHLPPVFKMAACRGSPLRSPGTLIKSFTEIQQALRLQGLPTMDSEHDLLFFDDMQHVLSGEIPGYVQVRPYLNYCPIDRVIDALGQTKSAIGSTEWDSTVASAHRYAVSDRREGYVLAPPNVKDYLSDRAHMLGAFRRFLGRKGGTGTRRMNRRAGREKTRRHK
jgi:hypothetical protein